MPALAFARGELANYARHFRKCIRTIGPATTAKLAFMAGRRRLGTVEPPTAVLRPRQVRYPLTMRLRGSSDRQVFTQIFIAEEYSAVKHLDEVGFILDCGANVGFTSAYLLNCFARATVIAVEPDERNVAICRENLRPYGDRACLLHGAVWSRCTELQLSRGRFRDGREWVTQVEEKTNEESATRVQAWDVPTLIEMAGRDTVDLLKIDVERAELFIFGDSAAEWLPRVRNICIELHGQDCNDAFFSSLKNFDYDLSQSGELTICCNFRTKSASASGQ